MAQLENKMKNKVIGIFIFEQVTAIIFRSQKVNKLQLEMENMKNQHKETVDVYKREIEAKRVTENKLLEEVRVVNFYATFS